MLFGQLTCHKFIVRAAPFKAVFLLLTPLSRIRFLALLLLIPGYAFPDFGDRWIPRHGDVPLLSGPEHSYSILARLGPTDVVRQESNKVIRGFLKVVLLHEPPVEGYIEQESLLFVGKPAQFSSAPVKGAPLSPKPKTHSTPPTPASTSWATVLLWSTVGIAIFVVVAFVVAWYVPGGKELPIVRELAGIDLSQFKSRLGQLAGRSIILRSSSNDETAPSYFDPRGLVTDLDASQGSLRDRGRRMLEMGDIEDALWIKAMTLSGGKTTVAKETYLELWTAKYGVKTMEGTKLKPAALDPPIAQRSPPPPVVDQGGPPSAGKPGESATLPPAQPPVAGHGAYLLPLLIIVGGIFVPMVAGAVFLSQVTLFVIQPIGAVPEGATVVAWRSDYGRLVDSPDAMCKRRLRRVNLLCRGAALSAFVEDHEIITRLPYNEKLYNLSFSD